MTSATSAKEPRWLYWNATPIARPFGNALRVSHADRAATAWSTPSARFASNPSPPSTGAGICEALSRSTRNCTGSFPAAWTSSSMNDWNTHE